MSTLATQLVHVSKKRGRSMGISVKVIYKLGGSYGYQSLYTSLCESQTHGKHKHMGIHTYTHASTHTHTHTHSNQILEHLGGSGVGTAQLVECPTQKPDAIPM